MTQIAINEERRRKKKNMSTDLIHEGEEPEIRIKQTWTDGRTEGQTDRQADTHIDRMTICQPDFFRKCECQLEESADRAAKLN